MSAKQLEVSKGSLARVLQDREGQSYRLFLAFQGDRYSLKLYDGKTCVGEARCSWQGEGAMALDDIAIANEASPALDLWDRLQQWVLGTEFEPEDYRRRGLGTLLLHSTIAHCRQLGASVLRGEVFQADVDNTPGLLQWYERQGFKTSLPRPEQIDVLANISLVLPVKLPGELLEVQPGGQASTYADEPQLSSSSH